MPDRVDLAWENTPSGAPPEHAQLVAQAPGAALVGFAARYGTAAEPTIRWRQIGIAFEEQPFQVTWNLKDVQSPQAPVQVAAVVCLAGEFPSSVLAAHAYNVGGALDGAETSNTVELADADRDDARQAACRYP